MMKTNTCYEAYGGRCGLVFDVGVIIDGRFAIMRHIITVGIAGAHLILVIDWDFVIIKSDLINV